MQNEKYSTIIIGAGIAGLSTGLAWLKVYNALKNPVLIIEKQPTIGGCVTTFAREGYLFDTVQIIPDVNDLLKFFDIEVRLKQFENYYSRLFLADSQNRSTKVFPVASTQEEFENYLIHKYPEDALQIKKFFAYCTQMHFELQYLKTEPSFWQIPGILLHCRKIIANSGKTYKQFLQGFHFINPEIYEVLDIFSSFSSLSGNRCAALLTSCAMVSTLQGSYRPEKGFIQFPVSLRKKFESLGGNIMVNTEVVKIITENDKATGVELKDGNIILADNIISTADTQVTFDKLVGYDLLQKAGPGYYYKAKNAIMSPSAFAIHLGLDEGIDLAKYGLDSAYNVLTTGSATHEYIFDLWEKGQLLISDKQFHMAVICSSLQMQTKPSMIIHVVPVHSEKWIRLRENDYEEYKKEKKKMADFYIEKVEKYIVPDLKNHIKFIDIATPATYARYIGSPTGSNFDMLPLPENFGKNRLKTRTPIRNLFLLKFSHGIWPSMQAGLQVVDMISKGKIMNGNSSYKSTKS
jgi:phytoene dehydrogenase-like protein